MTETNKILSDIRSYLRISAAAATKGSAAKTLDTYEKAFIYSKLDGKTSQRKIEKASGVPQPTISAWLTIFVEAGLVSPPDEYNESYRALFTLKELGIELTTLKKRVKGAKPILETTTPQTTPSEAQHINTQKNLEEEKRETTK